MIVEQEGREFVLREALKNRSFFDYIIVDCAPFELNYVNALLVEVFIPRNVNIMHWKV
jgi:cellulose biosynthesis protein BcsQ